MNDSKKKTIIKVLYVVYLCLLICFIFSNSMASKDESAGNSGAVLEFVNDALESVGIPFVLKHTFIRKAAHVIEFLTLGVSLFGFLILNKKVSRKNGIYCAFVSCLVAMTDETIQFFYERGSMLTDVWLDFASAVLGIAVSYLIYYTVSQKKKLQ